MSKLVAFVVPMPTLPSYAIDSQFTRGMREVVQHDISGLPDDAPDLALMRLLTQYCALRERRLEGSRRSQQTAANLVITTLQKRLFSSIEAFNSTLRVHRKSMEKLAATTEIELGVSADLLTELNAPDADDDRADRPEEEVTEGIEQAVASATERSKGSQQISQEEIAVLDRMAEIASQARRLADPRLTDAKHGLIPWIRKNLVNSDGTCRIPKTTSASTPGFHQRHLHRPGTE